LVELYTIMKRKLLIIISVVIILVTAGTIYFMRYGDNKVNRRQQTGMIAVMDKNSDNVISKDEFPKEMAKEFGDLDKDKDGKITVKEISPVKPPVNVDFAFKTVDKNNDGVITIDECPKKFRMKFSAADINNDGKVTKQEVDSAISTLNKNSIFKIFDKNGDGMLSKEECPGNMKEQFKAIDADNDGKLTADEVKSIKKEVSSGDWFTKMDKDNDGKIIFSECPKNFKQDFCVVDINQDKKITRTEFELVLKFVKDSDLFELFDQNEDGYLIPDECSERIMKKFSTYDEDKDGKLTLPEMLKSESKR
jgi:Ca2+-binding EF-hand superfamily protein